MRFNNPVLPLPYSSKKVIRPLKDYPKTNFFLFYIMEESSENFLIPCVETNLKIDIYHSLNAICHVIHTSGYASMAIGEELRVLNRIKIEISTINKVSKKKVIYKMELDHILSQEEFLKYDYLDYTKKYKQSSPLLPVKELRTLKVYHPLKKMFTRIADSNINIVSIRIYYKETLDLMKTLQRHSSLKDDQNSIK
uniref:Uncharacterized protein n=1 Tax=Pleurocladia lacustris TaxID=246121 RepID=A0A1I9LW49_9PHAE|nr:hypothetical protein [Pleurocladia lacustris]ANS57819.1 hypothetical protein [Pleurocladia lacustris]ANS57861.1 hypothetical protein [Pleurocladia lacustris]